MLFDLQSPRRRRAVQVIFGTLAAMFAISFIGFGIGSGGLNGGLFDALGIGGNSGGSGSTSFDSQISDAQDKVAQNPRNQKALVDLVTLNIQAGNQQVEGVAQNGYPITGSDSEDSFNKAADAWAQYLKLHPAHPDSGAALQLAGAFFVLAVNSTTAADASSNIGIAADAQRIAADENPSSGNLSNLVNYLYLAGRFAEGDAAAAQAVAKAPPSQRQKLRTQFAGIKKQAESFQKQVKAEAKSSSSSGSNPLDQGGGSLGGGGLSGGSLSGQ